MCEPPYLRLRTPLLSPDHWPRSQADQAAQAPSGTGLEPLQVNVQAPVGPTRNLSLFPTEQVPLQCDSVNIVCQLKSHHGFASDDSNVNLNFNL